MKGRTRVVRPFSVPGPHTYAVMTQISDYDAQNNIVRNPNGDGTFHEHTRDTGGVLLERKEYRVGSITPEAFGELAYEARNRLDVAVTVFGFHDVSSAAGEYVPAGRTPDDLWSAFANSYYPRSVQDQLTEAGNEAMRDTILEIQDSFLPGTLAEEDDRWEPGKGIFTAEEMTIADFQEAAMKDRVNNDEVIVMFHQADFDSHLVDMGLTDIDAVDAWEKFKDAGGMRRVEDAMTSTGSDAIDFISRELAEEL